MTLGKQLEQRFGINTLPYRLVLGDLPVMLEKVDVLQSIELYTNMERWQRARLPDLPAHPPQVAVAFEVEYDENHIASLELDSSLLWDGPRQQLALRLGAPGEPTRWCAVAETVFFGLDEGDRLCEVRCTQVIIQTVFIGPLPQS